MKGVCVDSGARPKAASADAGARTNADAKRKDAR